MAKSFRFESVVPKAEDLVKPKAIVGHHKLSTWDPLECYLSILFFQKEEQFLEPINNSIQNFLNKKHTNQGSNIHIYNDVKLGSFCVDNNTYGFELVFEDSVDWQYLKPSMLKKLVILTKDNFQTILLLSISSCSEENVKKGCIFAEPVLKTKIESEYFGYKFVLLETNVCFDSYYQTMSSLQKITNDSFPMIQYIVKDNCHKRLPSYFLHLNLTKSFVELKDAQFLSSQGKAVLSYLQKVTQHPRLDQSQLFALKCAFRREFAVIDGRSRTGKTFLASEIIRTMHENKESWGDVRSIIVICKTDEALDTILKSVIPYTQSIVRVGQSQTKDESLKLHSLMELRRELSNADKNSKCAKFHKKKLEVESLLGALHDLQEFLSGRSASSNLLFQSSLSNVYSPQQKEDTASQEELLDPEMLISYKKTNIRSWKNVKILDSLETLKRNCSTYEQLKENPAKILYLPLDHPERKNYFASFKSCMDAITKSKQDLEKRYFNAMNELREIKKEADEEVMNGKSVTGLTVARISKMQSTVRSLEAPIVLVDEAESVSECLLVCSTPKQCKHMILIGDQSKPGVMDSLFKRVSSRGHICAKLSVQHLTKKTVSSTRPQSIATTSTTLTTIQHQNRSQPDTVIVSASQIPSTTADSNYSSTVESSILLEPESASRTNSSSKPPATSNSRRSSMYECAKCSERFASKSQYDKHSREVHKEVGKISCLKCGKTFKFKSRLNAHMEVHNDKYSKQCEYCLKLFRRSNTLRTHIRRTHKKNINLMFECDCCKSKFATKPSIRSHLQACSQNNVKRKTSS